MKDPELGYKIIITALEKNFNLCKNLNKVQANNTLCFNDTKVKIVKRERILNGDLDKDESIRLVWYKKIDRRDLSDSSSSDDDIAKEA